MDPVFPLIEWGRLIEQVNITLNLLRTARSNTKMSSYAYLFGKFNLITTHLDPPGTTVVAYVEYYICNTWELNGEVGWYVGPDLHYYRCVMCYFHKTRSIRVCDRVKFSPIIMNFPQVNLID